MTLNPIDDSGVAALVKVLAQAVPAAKLNGRSTESLARELATEYERARTAGRTNLPPGRWPWRTGDPTLREHPRDLYELDTRGRWRYIGRLATEAHAEQAVCARYLIADQQLDQAYYTASESADAFRTALTKALGLPESPGDAELQAAAMRAIWYTRGQEPT